MNHTQELLREVGRRNGLRPSLYAVQKHMLERHGWSRSSTHNYWHGRTVPADDHAPEMASELGIDVEYLAALLQVDRARDEVSRGIWRRVSERLRQSAAAVVAVILSGVLVGAGGVKTAEASEGYANIEAAPATSPVIHYTQSWRGTHQLRQRLHTAYTLAMSAAATEILRDAYAGNLPNASAALRRVQLLTGWSDHDTARRLLTAPQTYRRWRADRRPNPTALRLLAIEAGYVPWRGWHGWEMHDGFLFPPGARKGLAPAQVEGLPFFVALARDLSRQGATRRPEPASVLDLADRQSVAS